VCLIDGTLSPSEVSIKCLAIMLEVKRIASVPGRIRALIVSMTTINCIVMVGVRWGTECSNMWLVFLVHSNNISLIHRGRANFISTVPCIADLYQ